MIRGREQISTLKIWSRRGGVGSEDTYVDLKGRYVSNGTAAKKKGWLPVRSAGGEGALVLMFLFKAALAEDIEPHGAPVLAFGILFFLRVLLLKPSLLYLDSNVASSPTAPRPSSSHSTCSHFPQSQQALLPGQLAGM